MAVTTSDISTISYDKIDNKHPEYIEFQNNWLKNQDANDGQEAIKNSPNACVYLPPLVGHTTEIDGNALYCTYKQYAVWFNATGRTVDGLLGLVFRKNPICEVPEQLDYIKVDCNTKKQTLDDFVKELFEQTLIKNRVGLLIDFPSIDNKNVRTRAEFERLNPRPYFTQYRAECIYNWRQNKINNEYQTTFVTLFETELVSGINEFENDAVQRIRVLDLDELGYYRQRVYERTVSTGISGSQPSANYEWQLVSEFTPRIKGQRLDYIPFFPITERGISWDIEYSAINDLTDVNIAHYRNSANYENALVLTGNPTPCLAGYAADQGDDAITLGSSRTLIFGPDGKWGFLSLEGKGVEALERSGLQKESQMALLGARIIAPEKRQVESAEAASIHKLGEQGVLANIANSISAIITQALKIAAVWEDVPANEIEDIKYELSTDYMINQMTPTMLKELVVAWQTQLLTDEEVFNLMKKGELIPAAKTFEEHVDEIENSTVSTNVINEEETLDDEIELEENEDVNIEE